MATHLWSLKTKTSRDVAEQRKQELQENKFNQVVKVSLDNLFSQIDEGNMKELDVIIKADAKVALRLLNSHLKNCLTMKSE